MNKKVFEKLKQAYSPLGLGDAILQAHADALVATGLVTEDNVETIVGAQKTFLEGLQKSNDTRASEAAKKAEERVRKQIEEETKKKEEEARKKAEEEAKKAEEEKLKKEAEEKKKAEEEAERQRLEEIKKQGEVPEYFKKYLEEQAEKQAKEKSTFEEMLKKITEENSKSSTELMKTIKSLQDKNKELLDGYNTMKLDAENAKKEAAAKAREKFIIDTAKKLAIPQSRIDEGFVITGEMTEGDIESYLGKVAGNIKAIGLPNNPSFQMTGDKPTKEETDAIAKMMIR